MTQSIRGHQGSSEEKNAQAKQIACSVPHMPVATSKCTQDMKQCIAALNQGLDLGDITWALLNSREFLFVQ